MKVAYLAPAPGIPVQGPSGASAHIRDVCSTLRERDIDLRVYSVLLSDHRGAYGPLVPASATGLSPWPSWLSRYRAIREVFSARRVATRLMHDIDAGWRPDLIWERHALFSDAGLRVHRKTGIPWVLEVNSPPTLERYRYESLPLAFWSRRWERTVLRAAPTVFAVSSWLTNWLQNDIGCSNVAHIPNGTFALNGVPERGRRLLGVDNSRPILGFVGSDKPWQNWRSLISISKALNMKLVLIGPFQNIEGAVCQPIYDPQDLVDVVSAFTVAAAPYAHDAPPWFSPLKIALYRGQSAPVAASDIGDCRLVMGEGGGTLAPADVGLTAAVERCLSLPRFQLRRTWHQVVDDVFKHVGR